MNKTRFLITLITFTGGVLFYLILDYVVKMFYEPSLVNFIIIVGGIICFYLCVNVLGDLWKNEGKAYVLFGIENGGMGCEGGLTV